MVEITSLLIFALVFLFSWMYIKSQRGKQLPPGPPTLPCIGNLNYVFGNRKFHLTVHKLAKEYGKIFSLQLCSYPVVFISDLTLLQDTMLHQACHFSDRPADNPFIKMVFQEKGMLFQNGYKWKKLRTLAVCTFHNFGVRQGRTQEKIHLEIEAMLKQIEFSDGVFTSNIFHKVIANLMCNVLFGARYEYSDPEFIQLVKDFSQVFANAGFQNIFHFLPVIFFPLMPVIQPESVGVVRACKRIIEVLSRKINQHRINYDPSNIQDFVDVYLQAELQEEVATDPKVKIFCEGQILQVLVDLISTGAETSSTSLEWAIYFLMINQDVQHKCRQQVLEVCGEDRMPTMKDRMYMPYVEATVLEVLRLGNIAPLPPLRQNPVEVTVDGYTIPAKSIIIQDLYSMHLNPKHWEDPHVFNPERFLNATGRVQKFDAFKPFGFGRRTCLGEPLAKMELLIFICAILQKFHLKPDGDLPQMTDANFGLSLKLPTFKVKAEKLNNCS